MFNKNNIAYLFLFFAILFWSGNFIVGKAASLYEIPPFSLNFYRWFFAWLILAPFTFKEILKKKNYILQNFKLFLILGITSITIFNSIVYYSLNFTQVISGVLMISTIPVMIIFISSILKIEKTNPFQIIGVILSLFGVLIIITKAKLDILINLDLIKAILQWSLQCYLGQLTQPYLKKNNMSFPNIFVRGDNYIWFNFFNPNLLN